MALRKFDLSVDMNGIAPNMISDIGTQGEHGVTCLNFEIKDEIYCYIIDNAKENKVMYRFDIYDGAGGVWQSEASEITDRYVSFTLEERHTRFGGKLTIYLVITMLSTDNITEIEMYNLPLVVCLNNRPDGIYQEGENYESVVSVAEGVKRRATEVANLAFEVEQKLNNGDFNGVGVEKTEIVNDNLIITYTNGVIENLGMVKGDKGDTPSLENCYTKDECDSRFASLEEHIVNVETHIPSEMYTNFYTKGETDTKIDDLQVFVNSLDEDVSTLTNTIGDIKTLLGGI